METNGDQLAQEKKVELLQALEDLGISKREFAKRLYCSENEDKNENEEEENKGIERRIKSFQKAMDRGSTKISKIEYYLEFLYNLPEAQRLNKVKLRSSGLTDFGEAFNKEMEKISKRIDKRLKEKEWNE